MNQPKYTKSQKEILINFGNLLSETPYEGNADRQTGLNHYCTLLVAHLRTRALGVTISLSDYGYFKDKPEARAKFIEGMRYVELSNGIFPHLQGKRIKFSKDSYGNEQWELDSTVTTKTKEE